jgi:ATP-dependent Clp protease ATP-binding subunit ClpC
MSAGRLTDSMGQTVDFRRTIVVFTSNLGNEASGRIPDRTSYKRSVNEAVRAHLAPEFLGRVDAVVVYRHLEHAAAVDIMRLKLEDLAATLRGVSRFDASEEALDRLAQEACSPDSGAREADRVLRRRVDPALVQMSKAGLLDPACPLPVQIRCEEGDFLFQVAENEA